MPALGKPRAVEFGVAALLILVGMVAIANIVLIGLAERAVDSRAGDLALTFRSTNSQALGLAAEKASRVRKPEEAERLARAALSASPINVVATRTLGQVLNARKPGSGTGLLLVSAKLGWRDRPTQIWMIEQAVRGNEPVVAVQRAEALVRLDQDRAIVATLLRLLAMTHQGRTTMVAALGNDPVWRPIFLTHQDKIPAQQLQPLVSILRELRDSPVPPRPAEARPALMALVEAGQVREAFQLHRHLFGNVGGSGLVSNPGFERTDVDYEVNSNASPFDWRVLDVGRSTASVEKLRSEEERVLRASAAGSLEGRIAEQTVVLGPGTYELSYRVRSPDADGPEQIRWSLRCSAGVPVLFEAPRFRTRSETWVRRRHRFVVTGGCPSQVLELRADPVAGQPPKDVEFDDVQLRRL
jgi:hypothetical protein